MLQLGMQSSDVERALSQEPQTALITLLELPEGQWFDRKSGRTSAKDLATILVAMGNAEGGTVAIGLHNGEADGVTPRKANELRQASVDHTVPPVRVRSREMQATRPDGTSAAILIVNVSPGEQVHTLTNGTAYLRVGDESRKLTPHQLQELNFDRGAGPYDSTPVDLTMSDLDADQLGSFAHQIGARSADKALEARDLITRRGTLTVAAALLFDSRPQREFPSAFIRVLRYGAVDRGLGAAMSLEDGADLRLEGSLPEQIQVATVEIERLMPKWRQLGPEGLFEPTPRIPRDAWLEGLVNAVVHRSYSMMGDHIRVEIFPNRVEISSPGRFPGIADPGRPLEISRYARNPRIARVLSDLGITRELGEGITRMFAEMRGRGLVDPMYTQTSSSVRLVLMAADAIPEQVMSRLSKSARAVLDALRIAGSPLGTGPLAEAAGVTRMTANRALASLIDEGLVTWSGSSKKDPRAVWALA